MTDLRLTAAQIAALTALCLDASTREALVTRRLAERRGDVLVVTALGRQVAGLLWASEAEQARETLLPMWSGDVPMFGDTA